MSEALPCCSSAPLSKRCEPLRPVRGMRDLIGTEGIHFEYVIDTLRTVARSHGFSPVELPIVEFTSLFARGLGEETDVVGKEMFTFLDRSGQSISLRPEGTASAVRAFLTAKLTQSLPQKWFYWGPMFRYDRPQKGRYRQFTQFGLETLGASSPLSDIEMIACCDEAIRKLGIRSATLSINSLGDAESRAAYKGALVDALSRYEHELSEDSQRRLHTNPLRVLDSKDPTDQKLTQDAPSLSDFLTPSSREFFDKVQEGLTRLGIPYEIDPRLVRGLDYYDHTTFEIKALLDDKETPLALLGGGRYNGLVQQLGGPAVPAVGVGFGVDRLLLLANKPETPSSVGVLFAEEADIFEAWDIARELRSSFSIVFPTEGNLSKRLRFANKSGAVCALILGDSERQKGVIRCKSLAPLPSLEEGREVDVPRDQLHSFLNKLLRRAL